MKKIGITGGIGSGKSVVSSFFRSMGIPVYDADSASKRLLVTDQRLKAELISLLGHDVYDGDNLNRAVMAKMIFNDNDLLSKVNAVIHPAVRRDCIEWFDLHANMIDCKFPFLAVESALIYEAYFENMLDCVLMVYAPKDVRISRVMRRDGMDEASVMARISKQMPDEQKKEMANYVIVNDGVRAIIPQVNAFLDSLGGKEF